MHEVTVNLDGTNLSELINQLHIGIERMNEIIKAAPKQNDKKWMSPKDFCEKYDIGTTTLYKLMKYRDFPRVKVGNQVRIDESAAHEWLVGMTKRGAF